MLGEDLVEEVLHAVNSRTMPQGWNEMIIVMIAGRGHHRGMWRTRLEGNKADVHGEIGLELVAAIVSASCSVMNG